MEATSLETRMRELEALDDPRVGGGGHVVARLDGRDQATARLVGVDTPERRALLRELGLELDARPRWERRGVGLSYVTYQKRGVDPRTGAETLAERQRIERNFELPVGDFYAAYVSSQSARRSEA